MAASGNVGQNMERINTANAAVPYEVGGENTDELINVREFLPNH